MNTVFRPDQDPFSLADLPNDAGWHAHAAHHLNHPPTFLHPARLRCETQSADTDALAQLAHILHIQVKDSPAGYLGMLSYELGTLFESASQGPTPTPPGSMLFDLSPIPSHAPPATHADASRPAYTLTPLTSTTGRADYETAVARAVEYIHAGDIFQANITHPMTVSFSGSAAALYHDLCARANPRFGALLHTRTLAGHNESILSISPELFLRYDATTRRIITRPIKGTAPLGHEAALLASRKDEAELNMIVDLMRNDLGRVCEPGSIRVTQHRAIEPHAGPGNTGLIHSVSTVEGTVRQGTPTLDILAATFPAGSITGAPKIRAMQIINDLEHATPRGVYTGSIGHFAPDSSFELSVAIRTATITPPPTSPPSPPDTPLGTFDNATLIFNVGAGIVAQSDPAKEWDETMTKCALLRNLADQHHANHTPQ